MSRLFSPLKLRELTFKNRVFVSPMCMYSSDDGMPTDWHLVHLGSRAVGGAALVIVEATAVSPEGRITPWDSGMWSPDHGRAFQRITKFITDAGAVPGIQLAHAGRKASVDRPWKGGKPLSVEQGGWETIAPSPIPFDAGWPAPREMSADDVETLVAQFREAARWSLDAGFEVAEIHMAHGYLLHQFLSPLSNRRTDRFGGCLENRMEVPLRVAAAVREVWPAKWPVFVRISATDYAAPPENGWDLHQSVQLARALKPIGIDLIDCSSGGNVARAKIELRPGYQVPFAETIRSDAGIPTGAVGLIASPAHAEEIVATEQADAILLARALLHDPYWPLHAAHDLGVDLPWPDQYARAKPRR
jgi:2,4-dienoyl-CoA reductase-like NADH-dependent reductase (Old Yellow Enzyme family)